MASDNLPRAVLDGYRKWARGETLDGGGAASWAARLATALSELLGPDAEVDMLRAAYIGWTFERRDDGMITCTLGGYHLVAADAAEARHGITQRMIETS